MRQLLLHAILYPQSIGARKRTLALALLIALHVAVFLSLQGHLFSLGITELIIFPVAVAGWFFGIRGGLLAGMLATPFNLLLLYLTNTGNLTGWLLTRGLIETTALLIVGLMIGHISTLHYRMNQQLNDGRQAEAALNEAAQIVFQREEMLRRVTDNMLDAVVEVDSELIIRYASPSCKTVIGYTAEQIIGQPALPLVHPDDAALAMQAIQSVFLGGEETIRVTLRALKAGGKTIWIETAGKVALDAQGKPYRAVFGVRDVTTHILTEQAEREQRALAEALRDTAAVLSSTLDQDKVLSHILNNIGKVVDHDGVNIMLVDEDASFTRITRGPGYGIGQRGWKETTLGMSFYDIPGFKWMAENRKPLVIADTRQYPKWVQIPGSEWVRSYISAPMFAHGDLVGFVNLDSGTPAFFNEKSAERLQAFVDQAAVAIENARLYAALQQQAVTDEVTQVYNRRGLLDLGQREFDRSLRFHRSLSALMFDVDHFKQVNDTYGHHVGDQVLRILAERCKGSIREVDILGRYGGEEFVILLVENDLHTATRIAARLCQVVDGHPFETTAGSIHITVSIGVSTLNEKTPDLSSLVQQADVALYNAKEQGRNCYFLAE